MLRRHLGYSIAFETRTAEVSNRYRQMFFGRARTYSELRGDGFSGNAVDPAQPQNIAAPRRHRIEGCRHAIKRAPRIETLIGRRIVTWQRQQRFDIDVLEPRGSALEIDNVIAHHPQDERAWVCNRADVDPIEQFQEAELHQIVDIGSHTAAAQPTPDLGL